VDSRSGSETDVYAQRVDGSGVPQWTADGLAISTATGDQSSPLVVSDGAGGAIIAWVDYRSGVDAGIYAQRVSAAGATQWAANGVVVCDTAGDQFAPAMVSDGAGGAIIVWSEARSGTWMDIYAQRINASGALQWSTNGVPICTASYTGFMFRTALVVGDGAGGAIIAWNDPRSGSNDIYAQRINSSGTVQWTADGVAVCTETGDQSDLSIASDGSGGAIIAWKDLRNGSNYDLYAQRINGSGTAQWTANGVAIASIAGNQTAPMVLSQGSSGAIITWVDLRSGGSDIYAQNMDLAGVAQWTANGVPVCTATGTQNSSSLVSDGSGGAIVCWQDARNGSSNNDIFASRLFSNGTLPVQLASFTARHVPGTLQVLLEWMTLSEINNYGFYVERRKHTEQRFREIPNSFVPGHGTTVQPQYYAFLDSTITDAGTYYYRLRQVDLDGTTHYLPEITIDVVTSVANEARPLFFRLEQNSPNPFNPATRIRFSIPDGTIRQAVSLRVFDVLGREVALLVNEDLQPGTYSAMWDAGSMPSGVYFYRLTMGSNTAVKRMLLVK
ncbi:MAG TPA: T9SS type A sorting domain-containing protein, partial [Bacteroidota bacterium]|nr:T9SS type A sorting domain-containing protein [Bacteroidota bacterium]